MTVNVRSTMALAAGLLCASLLLPACGEKSEKEGGRGLLLAKIDGVEVHEADLKTEERAIPPALREAVIGSPTGKKLLLDRYLLKKLLLREAYRRGIDKMPEVEEKIADVRREVIISELLRDVSENAEGLSDKDLLAIYEKNKESYKLGDRVKVAHVLFPTESEAKKLFDRAQKGEEFAKLMEEARGQGGNAADLGVIERGNFVEEFEKAAFAAPVGKPTGPVKTRYGFHVLLVSEKKEAGYAPFDEVKTKIRDERREETQKKSFETLVDKLKAEAKIDVEPARKAWNIPVGEIGESGEVPEEKGDAKTDAKPDANETPKADAPPAPAATHGNTPAKGGKK